MKRKFNTKLGEYWQTDKPVPSDVIHLYQEIHLPGKVYRGFNMLVRATREQVRPGCTVFVRGHCGYIFSKMLLRSTDKFDVIKQFMKEGMYYVPNHNHKIWVEREI